MSSDVAEDLARAISRPANGGGLPPEDLWPALSELADEGLLVGDEEALGTATLGPFRLATTRYRDAVQDFLEVLLPACVAGAAVDQPVHGVVSGTCAATCRCFIRLLRRGVIFRRGEPDETRWLVLTHVKELNDLGQLPAAGDVVERFDDEKHSHRREPSLVLEAVEWLKSAPPTLGGGAEALIVEHPDGGLECLV